MNQRILSAILLLCLCISPKSVAYAWQEVPTIQGDSLMGESISGPVARDSTAPTPREVYGAMIALKDQAAYQEGAIWTDDEPYSDAKGYYNWMGGTIEGKNISAVGCIAFAFILSDAAFGNLQARMYARGAFTFEDIKVGDILRVNNDAHTVIVLEVSDAGVVVAEGNISTGDHRGRVHWGRIISKEDVMSDTSHYITRYPEGYIPPDDPNANTTVAEGTLEGGLAWSLTQAGTLTISGGGAMPEMASAEEQPWRNNSSTIRRVVIGDGITSIGSCAFRDCGVLSAEIPSSVKTIGNSAFSGSSIISVTIPSSVGTIGDSAFSGCQSLSSVDVSEGLEVIGQNAFRSCTGLTSIALPASIGEVGAAAFFQCTALKRVSFAPGSRQVRMGDNMFTQCYNLRGVTLPANIDCISDGMFQDCLMLAGVEIPQGVASIGANAFSSCSSMVTVIIPDSVTTIGIAAFAGCPLEDIYFTGNEGQWERISKIGDTALTVSKATIHYNYAPPTAGPDAGSGSTDGSTDSNVGGNTGGMDGSTGSNVGGNTGTNSGNANNSGTYGGTQGGFQRSYHILEGADGLWLVNADGSITISADGELADFVRLEIDGRVVDPSNYTLRAGSTIVTLKPEFLKTLSSGSHTVTFVYKNGEVSMALPYGAGGMPVKAAAPKTGDESALQIYVALFLLSAALVAVVCQRKKESPDSQAL